MPPVMARAAEDEAPSSDVSERAGAVWGGASAQTRNGVRKRGPGRGGNAAVVIEETSGSATAFPTLPSDVARPSASPIDSSSSPSSGQKKPVYDVMAMAKDRQARSALPKVGGSGYGFAWDRKKMRAKKKEVRNEVLSGSAAATAAKYNAALRSNAFSPQLAASETQTTSASVSGAVCSETSSVAEHDSPSVSSKVASSSKSGDSSFDQYSYLPGKQGNEGEDPLSSFLGT
jgi:hypothetical protein